MKFAAMLRVRNEARWIDRVVASILPLTSRIFVLDDHSVDDTARICRSFEGVQLLESPFDGLDETRDKNYLLDHLRQSGDFDWVLHIDGDEELEHGAEEKIVSWVRQRPNAGALTFRVCYLWDRPDQWRSDGVYGRFTRPSMFRLSGQPSLRFQSTRNGGNFHCGNVPAGVRGSVDPLPVRLLHYGYMYREDRLRKHAWYNEHDPRNVREDFYRHVAQGDLPDIPADAKLLHAGPLRLEPFLQ